MRILILHLSDMHIVDSTIINNRGEKIISALNSIGKYEHCLLLVSGDIASKAKDQQYKVAGGFFRYLYKAIKQNNKNACIRMAFVPGNHDVDLSKNDLGRAKTDKIFECQDMDSHIDSELFKQQNFIKFANSFRCFLGDKPEDHLFDKQVANFEQYKIEINLINTALFSTLESDKGNHYLPQNAIKKINRSTGADFVITVMHHPAEWFCDQNNIELENAILSKSSLLLLGHAHFQTTKNISYNETPNAIVFAGGKLGDDKSWDESEYFANVFDTNTYSLRAYRFSWDKDADIYKHKKLFEKQLPAKPSIDKHYSVKQDYLLNLTLDERGLLKCSIDKFFVFPRLSIPETSGDKIPKDIDNEEDFLKLLEENKRVTIMGHYNYGKSTLSKYLFLYFMKEKRNMIPIFCTQNDIYGKKRERIIRRIFEEAYSDDQTDFLKFQQLPPSEKVLILDNIDEMKKEILDAFLEDINDEFGYLILTTKEYLELNVLERAKSFLGTENSFTRVKIEPFYADKREELVRRIVSIKKPDNSNENIVEALCHGLNSQRHLMSFDPDFIIRYVILYCNNIEDIVERDTTIFSKVFEANLTNALIGAIKKTEISVDKIFIILSKIAYEAHIRKEYPIQEETILEAISDYKEFTGDEISAKVVLDIICSAKIVKQNEDMYYSFVSKSYFAYFVASAIVKLYMDSGNIEDIEELANLSCFNINADILLFITYLTDSINIIAALLEAEKRYTYEWQQYSVSNNNIAYLEKNTQRAIDPPNQEAKNKDLEVRVNREKKEEVLKNGKISNELYNYDETEVTHLFNQFKRVLSLLNIISRSLPSFEHNLSKEQKKQIIKVIYELPNKFFYMWANEVDKQLSELVQLIKEMPEDEYRRNAELTDEEIICSIKDNSLVLLLELYNIANVYSVRPNTIMFLDNKDYYNYNDDLSHRMQHVMMLECARKVKEYVKETLSIFKASSTPNQRNMMAYIAKHFMIHSSKYINRGDMQRLMDTFFPINNPETRQGATTARAEIIRLQAKKSNIEE